MPRYRRYGYVLHETRQNANGELVGADNVGFQHNPKKAHEDLDAMIAKEMASKATPKTRADTTFSPHSGLLTNAIRSVLIEYPDGSQTILTIERWHVVVGKE